MMATLKTMDDWGYTATGSRFRHRLAVGLLFGSLVCLFAALTMVDQRNDRMFEQEINAELAGIKAALVERLDSGTADRFYGYQGRELEARIEAIEHQLQSEDATFRRTLTAEAFVFDPQQGEVP